MFRSVRTPHVVAAATFVAFLSAQPYTGSWNDGSRLATVEALVDYGTLAIDDSVFVRGAPALASADQSRPRLGGTGTLDKMLVGGRFYSDKPPVPALFLAGPYAAWRWSGGPSAVERPDAFCWLMTLCLCGPAYVLAVWGMWSLVRRAAVPGPWDVALTASFALGTIALPYAQHVNQHLPLLAVAVWVVRLMLDPPTAVRAALLGFLAGLGYTLDLGAGPPLLAAAGAWLLWQGRWKAAVIFAAAALPWLALHHAVNFAVGGTFGPANANPEYFRWPGSPFSEANMTGGAVHPNAGKALLYAADLLLGKRGFLLHDMPLLLAALATPALLLRRFAERPVVVAGACWAAATWLLYAAMSNNLSGACVSIRWFVPLLAPGYLVLAVVLRDRPDLRPSFVVLAVGGAALSVGMTLRGPWCSRVVPGFWPIFGVTMAVWAVVVWRGRRPVQIVPPAAIRDERRAA